MYCTRTRHGVIVWPRWRNVFLSKRFQAFPSWRARVLSRTAAVRIQSAGACVLLKRIFSYFFFFLCFFLLLDETRTVDALIHTCSQHGNLYIFPNGPPPHGGPVSVVVPLPRRAAATTFCRRVSRPDTRFPGLDTPPPPPLPVLRRERRPNRMPRSRVRRGRGGGESVRPPNAFVEFLTGHGEKPTEGNQRKRRN